MENFTTEIKPKDKLFNLELKEVWAKKYLLWLFIKRDILVQFKQTIFGLGWYFISPLVSTAIYIIIFSRVAGIPTDGIPKPLFYLSGQCLWNYFSQCLTKVSETFATNSDLFGKVYFPRIIMPISQVVSHLFRFSIQMTLFVIVYVIYAIVGVDVHPNWYLLLFPVLVLMLGFTAMGLGLIVTSMTAKYRDLKNFFGVFVSLWMYATPIVYPMSVIENPALKNIMRLNPLTSIIEAFKYGSMGAGEF
ncbi:MAG: ABC transporter permease, partial [bacterium]|nr:ABC transporter permease [Candidatus Limimorpha equi]